jgi:glycosyltransferase involved in cell wall biosynthesis
MGYRVVVVCMGRRRGEEKKKERMRGHEIVSETLKIYRVRDLFLPDPFNYGIAPTFPFHVLSVLKKEKPDIVIVNKVLFWSSLVTPVLRLIGKRPIVTTDALVGITWWPRGFFPTIIMSIGAWTAGWLVLLSASRVVFFHPQPAKILTKLCIAKKSCVIPTGIDSHGYECVIKSDNRDDCTVTYIGRLESVKGVDDFLAAAVPLKKEYQRLHIQVVGWYRDNHPLVTKYRDTVDFTGLRDDIPDILKETDLFVLPSYSEGLSNALMEAMSSGCACIATEVGGNRFLIQNGVSGFLYPSGDRAMLQAHIRRLIDDTSKRQMMGRAARERIEKEFDWKVVEKKYATLFAELHG